MNEARRVLLRSAGASGVLLAAMAAGLLRPGKVLAADWNKAAFTAKDMPGALGGIGASAPAETKDLTIKAPDIAENGAVVPVEITSTLPGTQEISVFVEKNPLPLAAQFNFLNGAMPIIAVRLKMGETSNVRVVAKADGKFYTAAKEVKVTIGGCGG